MKIYKDENCESPAYIMKPRENQVRKPCKGFNIDAIIGSAIPNTHLHDTADDTGPKTSRLTPTPDNKDFNPDNCSIVTPTPTLFLAPHSTAGTGLTAGRRDRVLPLPGVSAHEFCDKAGDRLCPGLLALRSVWERTTSLPRFSLAGLPAAVFPADASSASLPLWRPGGPHLTWPLTPSLPGGLSPRNSRGYPPPLCPWLLARHSYSLGCYPFSGWAEAGVPLYPWHRKPKRIRTAFSPGQLQRLERAFGSNHYLVGQDRRDLARHLALTETQVKVWFQNRRTKHKRLKAEEDNGGGADGSQGQGASPSFAHPSDFQQLTDTSSVDRVQCAADRPSLGGQRVVSQPGLPVVRHSGPLFTDS